ncbi:RIP metalloprotease RseP [Bizionia argentinensis JUB59]|uniref:Zinc metalloprotease n=1 Tax=Bizionia argentinensis JUB59 TaxID=1046627 RepID=G2ECM9_9FLAO|nr:RIP metalloprotease RseP [Bizionia argentinensis]EGV43806.2 RIP metalloprotease RseP [Bizionia argentinensis JUB59]
MTVILIKAAQLFLSLSILIVLHELGHFIPAKLFGTRVEKFYLFFDIKFSLFKKKIGDTVYGIGWLPLGGYVKIAGMIDESMDKEQMALPAKPWEFRSKPSWQRLVIMLGGVTVNFILGFVIYMMILFVWGTDYANKEDIKYGFGVTKTMEKHGFQQGDRIVSVDGTPFHEMADINTYLLFRNVDTIVVERESGVTENLTIPEDIGTQLFEAGDLPAMTFRVPFKLDSIVPGSPADKAGLLVSDKLLYINGTEVNYLSDLTYMLKNKSGDVIDLVVKRDGENKVLKVTPNPDFTLGVLTENTDLDYIKVRHKDYSFGESITKGASVGYWKIKDYLGQFKYIFTKKGAASVGGFAAIGNMFPPSWDWRAFWEITAFLSIMLGVLNLMPIPALDGGHVMFLLYEIVSGRKPGDKFMEYAQLIGFILLISLVLFANGNDIYKAIFE